MNNKKIYTKPTLKKYGKVQELTLKVGSNSDAMGPGRSV
jgi:hypothetical protein